MGTSDSKLINRTFSTRSFSRSYSYDTVSSFSKRSKEQRLKLDHYWVEPGGQLDITRSQSLCVGSKSSYDQKLNALAAAQAFKRHSTEIIEAGESSLQFINLLLSSDILPEATKTRVLFSRMTRAEKIIILVDAVEARILLCPQVFHTLVTTLQDDYEMNKIGGRLLNSYQEYSATYAIHLKAIALPAIVRYADYLKAYYKALLSSPNNKWPPAPSKKPFNLSCLSLQSTPTLKDDNTPISLQYLLAPSQHNSPVGCVLLTGDAGVGKTYLTVELCKCWDQLESLKRYDLILLVRGHDSRVQEAKILSELFVHHNSSLQQAVTKEVDANGGDGFLLIIDHVPSSLHHNSILLQILQGKVLPKCTLLLVCRSTCTTAVLSKCKRQVDRHVELKGFCQEEIEQHAESSLGCDSTLLSDFHDYLSSNPVIGSTLHIPLHTAVVVELFRESKLLGVAPVNTLYGIYDQLVRHLLSYHITLLQGGKSYTFPEKLEDLPSKVYQQLCCVAKQAYTAVVNQDDSPPKPPKGSYHLGFMVAVPELYARRVVRPLTYSYIHPFLQEYLAALHVCNLPENEQRDFFKHHFNSPHLRGLWRFIAGRTQLKGALWEEKLKQLADEGLVCSSFLNAIFESHVSLNHLLENGVITFPQASYGEDVLPTDLYKLGCCLSLTNTTLKLRLRLDTDMLHQFTLGLQSTACTKAKLDTLYLRPPITSNTITALRDMSPAVLTGLDLSHCGLDHSITQELANVIPHFVCLECLDIRGNTIGNGGGTERLFHKLATLTTLKSLNVINTGLGCADIKALPPLLSSLQQLCIGEQALPAECVQTLLNITLTRSTLSHLQLWLMDLQPHMALLASLLSWTNLLQLEFHGCKVGGAGCQLLADGLSSDSALETLVLSMFEVPQSYQLGLDGALALADMLKVNKILRRLEIMFDSSMEHDGILALASSLTLNTTLHQLTLPQLNLTHVELCACARDTRVKWCS